MATERINLNLKPHIMNDAGLFIFQKVLRPRWGTKITSIEPLHVSVLISTFPVERF
jgi:hypothetical protein